MSAALNVLQVITKLKEETLSLKTTYKLAKLLKALTSEQEFYSTRLTAILSHYAITNEDGTYRMTDDGTAIQIRPDCVQNAQKEFNELLNLEIELPDLKIPLEELETIKLSVDELNQLIDFIEE